MPRRFATAATLAACPAKWWTWTICGRPSASRRAKSRSTAPLASARQQPLGGGGAAAARGAEAAVRLGEDEGGVAEHVRVAGLKRQHAELALLAVAQAEGAAVERSELRQRLALEIEADADAGGQA